MEVFGCWLMKCHSQSGSDLIGLSVLENWPVHTSCSVRADGARPQGSYTWPHGRGQPSRVGVGWQVPVALRRLAQCLAQGRRSEGRAEAP